MNAIIKKVEASYLKESLPNVEVGDTVEISLKVVEETKERIQKFSGFVIAMGGTGVNLSIKVRKLSFGVGVEKTISLHSPYLKEIVILKKAKVRRAKLYYMRDRLGKKAVTLPERKVKSDKGVSSPK